MLERGMLPIANPHLLRFIDSHLQESPMPPRYAYWTILIDGKATAFRAREREELLPTFNQLARKNADIVMRYFARGRLWDNPEQAQWASRTSRGHAHGAARPRLASRRPAQGSACTVREEDRSRRSSARVEKSEAVYADRTEALPIQRAEAVSIRRAKTFPIDRSKAIPIVRSKAASNVRPKTVLIVAPSREGRCHRPKTDRPTEGRCHQQTESRSNRPTENRSHQPTESHSRRPIESLGSTSRGDQPKDRGARDSKPSDSKDRREPRFDSRGGKRPGTWSRPPKRKPR